MVISRFAPSPTGLLHLGSAYSALYAHQIASRSNGRFLLRIEDIDNGRCRPEFETTVFEDLEWLGLSWEMPVRRQSEHFDDYSECLRELREQDLLYPCFCTRSDIAREIKASGAAPHGPDGPVYPGICRDLHADERRERIERGVEHAWRMDMERSIQRVGKLSWHDDVAGEINARPERFGDVVIARKDVPTSYHLSVVYDDHLQGVTTVPRGEDLFDATDIHRLLQALLGFETPLYSHHRLLRGPDGKRLAKRDRSTAIAHLREDGFSAVQVKSLMGWTDD